MNDKVVFLSPSTQEFNVGYGNFGTEEYRMNRIADIVERLLKEFGWNISTKKKMLEVFEDFGIEVNE